MSRYEFVIWMYEFKVTLRRHKKKCSLAYRGEWLRERASHCNSVAFARPYDTLKGNSQCWLKKASLSLPLLSSILACPAQFVSLHLSLCTIEKHTLSWGTKVTSAMHRSWNHLHQARLWDGRASKGQRKWGNMMARSLAEDFGRRVGALEVSLSWTLNSIKALLLG